MKLLRQLAAFGVVGIAATLTHVAVAWLVYDGANWGPIMANLAGASAAFCVSFIGNFRVTFHTDRTMWNCARRYLAVSLLSFAMASLILVWVERADWPTYAYALIVIITIPPTTFLLAKLWAFTPMGTSSKNAESGPR